MWRTEEGGSSFLESYCGSLSEPLSWNQISLSRSCVSHVVLPGLSIGFVVFHSMFRVSQSELILAVPLGAGGGGVVSWMCGAVMRSLLLWHAIRCDERTPEHAGDWVQAGPACTSLPETRHYLELILVVPKGGGSIDENKDSHGFLLEQLQPVPLMDVQKQKLAA